MEKTEQPQITIVHLFQKMEKMQEEMAEVKQVLNNGIVKTTANNTDAICGLTDEISDIKKVIVKGEGEQEGKLKVWHIVISIVTGIGGGIVSTVTVLHTLGLIGG